MTLGNELEKVGGLYTLTNKNRVMKINVSHHADRSLSVKLTTDKHGTEHSKIMNNMLS